MARHDRHTGIGILHFPSRGWKAAACVSFKRAAFYFSGAARAVIIPQSCGTEPFRGCRLEKGAATMGDWIMTEDTQHHAVRRNSLLEAALEEMAKFERKEIEFRKKDRAERAADLRLPLDEIKVH
ncbi:hypothetical protein ABID58_003118 [Bradyrhizobium sp. S3.2.6]|uniref:hypothetical protein n=1 Tax=Bradyrhizobium sp. S3.2.6 TaxID=3156428 RepID=UPI00339A0B74